MKTLIVNVIIAVLMSCTSCVNVNIGKIKPSSNIVKNEYKMESFDKVDIDLVAKVKFVQSADNDYRVMLKCPDNYVDLFKFEVDGDKLKAGFTKRMHNGIEASDVSIIICSPTLLQLNCEGVATIVIDSLNTPSFHLGSEGVGNISISGLTTETLKVESDGVATIELKGTTQKASLENNGVGSINAEKLLASEVKAEVNGVGSISCFASERIKAEVNGVGSLTYGGKPKATQFSRNGIGKISEL